MSKLRLLSVDGSVGEVELAEPRRFQRPDHALQGRIAFAAAHIVPRVSAENVPGHPADIDWESTLAFRRHLWSWGLGVADAMDTAQRNMGLDPLATRELIKRTAAEAKLAGGRIVAGFNTDHLDTDILSIGAVIDAYVSQLEFVEETGSGTVMMASRHLARAGASSAQYERVYRSVLARATRPVILHWLGTAFDPQLAGYFGSRNSGKAIETLLRIVDENRAHISGIKMSLLDPEAELAVRRRLPVGVRMFTGDDFNYVELIEGNGEGYSDALLGAFAAIAPAASAAIQSLQRGNFAEYHAILDPTQKLARRMFEKPTFNYKADIAFLSWLNGHQPAFAMVGGMHAARSLVHLSAVVRLANACGALENPYLAAGRWATLLLLNGVTR
jgi:Protein of unknown function (DUF993)